jgi:hypothetical protein
MINAALWVVMKFSAHLQVGNKVNVIPQASLQTTLVVAWLQSSNKGYSSRPYGSRTALPNRLRTMKDLSFPRRWLWRIVSSGMFRRVALVRSDVSEELSVSIIRATRIGWTRNVAVTSNPRCEEIQSNIPEDAILGLRTVCSAHRFLDSPYPGHFLSQCDP